MIPASKQAKRGKAGAFVATADAWLTPGRFAILLGALIAACFPAVIFGLKTFYYHDFGTFGCPLAFYHRTAFWHGRMPLWNPYNLCGLPFMAQWNTLTLYPLSLFYLLFPLSWSLGVFNLAHMYLAGMGMYFLAHRWNGNRLAASVAGLVYAFNGLTWHALMWPNNIAALGWMPWVVLCAERAWHAGATRNIIAAGLAGAMQMLAGAPEVIILTWVVIGTLWSSEWLKPGAPRGKMLARIAGVGVSVAGLAAAQLIPFLDLLSHSQRDESFGGSIWAMPLGGWGNYVVPLFHYFLSPGGIYNQSNQYWTASYYLGVGTIALALLALWRVRERRMWVLAGLALFGLTMAWGEPGLVYAAARRILPAMGFMRFPIKFVILPTFAIPLMAAQAVGWWQALPEARRPAERRRLWGVGFCVLAAMLFVLWREWFVLRYNLDNPTVITENAAVRVVFLGFILGFLAFQEKIREPRWQRAGLVCLLLLFWCDVLTHNRNLSPTVARRVFEPNLVRHTHVSQGDFRWDELLQQGKSRAMPEWVSLARPMFHEQTDAVNDTMSRRLSLFCNYNLFDLVPKFDGLFSLDMREMDVMNRYAASSTTNSSLPLFKDFLSISYVISRTNETAWEPRDTYLPLITAGQKPIFLKDTNALQALVTKWFDPVHSVYLPHEAQPFVMAAAQPEAKVVSSHFETERVEAQVEAPGPAMVVVAQAYYHCWQAYVDGKQTPLLRANYAFQALEVPAGKHDVVLKYEDYGFVGGVIISGISLLVCAVMWFRERTRDAAKTASQIGTPS